MASPIISVVHATSYRTFSDKGYVASLLYLSKTLQKHKLYQIKVLEKIHRTKLFVGQKCRNFGLVSKVLSVEKFCPSKILSDEFCSIRYQISAIRYLISYVKYHYHILFIISYIPPLAILDLVFNINLVRSRDLVRNFWPIYLYCRFTFHYIS